MKKKTKIIIVSLVLLIIAVLFVPVPTGAYKDGGTRTYTALTYKVVRWKVLVDAENTYEKTSVFWYPDNFKSYEELWDKEKEGGL
ncbi:MULTISPECIES: hypothetical protein [Ruminococcus]|uniref:Uncharacterized protein n=1 Tax=Ruminococcus flavefaciens TaxID=1265 RepID=A0A1M7I313_RUMFL|nr:MULTISPECIES: hypothetical protein [Ruminococcus]MCR4795111.1 hypothetical protein [Ruminococcus sp.]SHM35048.1 hypothetical protein SAMN04487860_103253 [Ruminococcus flavefaciens]